VLDAVFHAAEFASRLRPTQSIYAAERARLGHSNIGMGWDNKPPLRLLLNMLGSGGIRELLCPRRARSAISGVDLVVRPLMLLATDSRSI
jgi:hypothetical protein